MTGIIVSTIAFFVAGYFIKRSLDRHDIPKSLTRSLVVFVLALGVAYAVAAVVERMIS